MSFLPLASEILTVAYVGLVLTLSLKRQKYVAVSHQNNKAAARAHKGADNIADCNILDVTLIWLKALKRSKEIGMDQTKIKKTIKTAAIFTIAPAVAIVISVMTLSQTLGLPLPWLRLSVVGSMSYETIAASNALFIAP